MIHPFGRAFSFTVTVTVTVTVTGSITISGSVIKSVRDTISVNIKTAMTLHYEIAPIETRRPIKVGYHDALRALQSVPLLAVSFVSQHASSRVFVYLFAQKEGVYVRKR